MSELNAVVAGLQITVLMLAASALVFIHLKMYFEWKSFKDMEARTDAALRRLEELSKGDKEERLKNETGNSR